MIEQTSDTELSQIYRRRWWTLAVLAFSILVVVIDITILNIALPTLQRELKASGSELQWIVDVYPLAFAALLLTMGALGDRLGRARMLGAGLLVFAAASLAAAFAETASHLIAARVFMGIGASMIMPATLAIITNVFPREERGKAIGAWSAINGAGVALGPLLGGILLEHFSWSAIFLVNLPIVAVAIIAGRFLVPDSRDPHPRRPDPLGTVLSGAALSSLIFGLIKGGDWGWTDPVVLGTIVGAIAIGVLFVARERHAVAPMLDIWLFRNPRFAAGVVSLSISSVVLLGVFFAFTLYMQFVHGYSALETGIIYLPCAAGLAMGSIMSHRRVQRFGTTRVIAAGFLGMTTILVLYSFLQVDTTYWQLGLLFFPWGFFIGNIIAPSMDSVLGAVPEAEAGVGSAMTQVSSQVGGAVGIAALGSVIASVYSSRIEPAIAAIAGLPAEAADAARDSVGGAMVVADTLPGGAGDALAQAAGQSFMDGWQVLMLVSCVIGVMGAGFALKFMPPHHLPKEGAEEVDAEPPGEGIGVLQGDLEAMPAEETDLRTGRQGDADGDYRL